MSAIPLRLQRRFEQRWASRFTLPAASNAPKKVGTNVPHHQQLVAARGGKDQRKPRRREPAGFVF